MDSNHDIVPTLRMMDGVYTGLAADEIERLRVRVALLERRADTSLIPGAVPTHRCKVCGAYWRKWTVDGEASWNLNSHGCGECCDNVAMGDQIEALTSPAKVGIHNPEAHGLPPYPTGKVAGPCVCGSWPGGECLRCAVVPAKVGGDEVQRVLNRLDSSDPDFDDCASAAALIIRMAEEMKGPDGFGTWKDAALAERARLVPFQELEKLFLIALDFGIGFGPRLSEVGEWPESRSDKAKALAIQARAALTSPAKPCEYCNDTGDVHDRTGEWRGTCTCPAGAAISSPVKVSGDGLIEQHHRDSAELRRLCEARDQARRTAEYWKANHLAGNAEIERLKKLLEAKVGGDEREVPPLPPLPKASGQMNKARPKGSGRNDLHWPFQPGYTADQMRDYARAALSADCGEAAKHIAFLTSETDRLREALAYWQNRASELADGGEDKRDAEYWRVLLANDWSLTSIECDVEPFRMWAIVGIAFSTGWHPTPREAIDAAMKEADQHGVE